MRAAHIIGTGSAVPERVLTNEDLVQIVDTTDEWITRRTGIKERHISHKDAGESTADLGTRAVLAALSAADVNPDQIDTIIVATVTADRQFPSAACMIQKAIGANHAAAFDLSAGCSGFLYALDMANSSIRSGSAETILVVGAERLSSVVDWHDRGTCVLLGDGAGAVLLRQRSDAGGILSTHIKSDGRLWDLLYASDGNDSHHPLLSEVELKPFSLKMEGNRLFKKAVGSMADIGGEALTSNGLSQEDIKLVIPHQANLRIVQAVAEKLKVPMEQVFTNLHKYGNTSSASIPLALDEAHRSGKIDRGDHLLLLSFGAGLTWGASAIKWSL